MKEFVRVCDHSVAHKGTINAIMTTQDKGNWGVATLVHNVWFFFALSSKDEAIAYAEGIMAELDEPEVALAD